MPVERRPYGPDSTPEEIDALRARVVLTPDGLPVFDEVPVMSVFSVGVLWDRFEELVGGRTPVSYVADLSAAERPNAEVRAALRARIGSLRGRLGNVGLVVGDNVVIRAMARIFAFSMGLRSVTLHRNKEEALAEVRRANSR